MTNNNSDNPKKSVLSPEEELALIYEELANRQKYRKFESFFPDEGPLSIEHYPNHKKFYDAGKHWIARAILAGNQTGKTTGAGIELTSHLTGRYRDWWDGKRFDRPIVAWAVGYNNPQTVDVLQRMLCGPMNDLGSGIIPREDLKIEFTKDGKGKVDKRNRSGVSGGIGMIYVRWYDENGEPGGWSELHFKSAEQGFSALQGVTIDFILLDEDSGDVNVFTECFFRIIKNKGCIVCTFTPTLGLSSIAEQFMPLGYIPDDHIIKDITGEETGKWAIRTSIYDVPHLDDEQRAEMVRQCPPHLRDARIYGMPVAGEGRIYPFSEDQITCEPFIIPPEWPKWYGMDPGIRVTAVNWFTEDPNTGTIYMYDEYHAENQVNVVIKEAIMARGGDWMMGSIDSAARQRSGAHHDTTLAIYQGYGLKVYATERTDVEAGILLCYDLFVAGKLKIFRNLEHTKSELRKYRRDEKNGTLKIVKPQADHHCDAMRYAIHDKHILARSEKEAFGTNDEDGTPYEKFWELVNKGANKITGY